MGDSEQPYLDAQIKKLNVCHRWTLLGEFNAQLH